MNDQLFSKNAPGKLVKIDFPSHHPLHSERSMAFVPDSLPSSWQFETDIWPLLAQAKEVLGTLNGIGQTLVEPELLLTPLQNREAITSSRIEGTFVTPEQLLLIGLDNPEQSSPDHEIQDWWEVFNYSEALKAGKQMVQENNLTNFMIRSIHQILMHGVRGRNKSPGKFRDKQVIIGSDGRYIPPPPAEVSRLMENFELYINDLDPQTCTDPLIKCFIAHYQFEAIHPFEDGNGRVGRALLALMIYKHLKHAQPWLYLSSFFDQYKEEYISNMFRISTEGRWRDWIMFCLRATITQASEAIFRCRGFNELKEEFHRRVQDGTPRTFRLINSLFIHPVVSIKSTQEMLGVQYNTAKRDIDVLVSYGILQEMIDQKPKRFFAPAIMKIAYSEQFEEVVEKS